MKNFFNDLQIFEKKIDIFEPFSFARYGDGEMFIMQNKFIDILHKENGEFRFDPSNVNDQLYRNNLINSFKNKSENYYVGIGCPCCVGINNFSWMKNYSEQNEFNLTWANLFVNSNYPYFLSKIVPLFNKYDVYIVCNEKATLENLSFRHRIKQDWRVGSDAWKNSYWIEEEIKNMSIQNSLFLFAAGPFSKILCYNLWIFNNKNIYLDIGSVLDPFLFGSKGYTREYLKGGADLMKICRWQ